MGWTGGYDQAQGTGRLDANPDERLQESPEFGEKSDGIEGICDGKGDLY